MIYDQYACTNEFYKTNVLDVQICIGANCKVVETNCKFCFFACPHGKSMLNDQVRLRQGILSKTVFVDVRGDFPV